MTNRTKLWSWVAIAALVPVAHPLLLPHVGVPSHLLWWVLVLPVAMISFRYGRSGLWLALLASALWLVLGERWFGAGYGNPADWATVGSLGVALVFTEGLVGGFALYARSVSRRFELLFLEAESGVILTSSEGGILEANPAAARLLNRSRSDLEGRSMAAVAELASLPDPDEIQAAGGWVGSVEVQGESGPELIYLLVAATPSDEPKGHQILLMDRTAQASAEMEQERQRKLATLGEGLAGVAHELKNPLTVILAWGDMIRSDPAPSPEDMAEAIEEMHGNGVRMRTLVEELLGYSRPSGTESVLDLARLLRRLISVEHMVRGERIRLENRIHWEGTLDVPEARVEQIVTNLLSNSAEAMGSDGGRIEVRCWSEETRVVVEVADTGPGVPPELLERIFQPFITTRSDSGGTGLGLAISRRLARAMGGDLQARNRSSGGAAFRLFLPNGRPVDPPEGSETEEEGQNSTEPLDLASATQQ